MLEAVLDAWVIASPAALVAAYFFGRAHGILFAKSKYDLVAARFVSRINAAAPTSPPPSKPVR